MSTFRTTARLAVLAVLAAAVAAPLPTAQASMTPAGSKVTAVTVFAPNAAGNVWARVDLDVARSGQPGCASATSRCAFGDHIELCCAVRMLSVLGFGTAPARPGAVASSARGGAVLLGGLRHCTRREPNAEFPLAGDLQEVPACRAGLPRSNPCESRQSLQPLF